MGDPDGRGVSGGVWIYTDPDTLYEGVSIAEQYDAVLFVDQVTPATPTARAYATAQARRDF